MGEWVLQAVVAAGMRGGLPPSHPGILQCSISGSGLEPQVVLPGRSHLAFVLQEL